MKNTISILLAIFLSLSLNAQDLLGSWIGVLEVQGSKMRIGFNFSKDDNSFTTTMDSPDQKAFGIPAKTISLQADNIHIL